MSYLKTALLTAISLFSLIPWAGSTPFLLPQPNMYDNSFTGSSCSLFSACSYLPLQSADINSLMSSIDAADAEFDEDDFIQAVDLFSDDFLMLMFFNVLPERTADPGTIPTVCIYAFLQPKCNSFAGMYVHASGGICFEKNRNLNNTGLIEKQAWTSVKYIKSKTGLSP